jgi:hypothetical protein
LWISGDLEFEKRNADISEFVDKMNRGLFYRYTSLKDKDFIGAFLPI